MVSCAWEGEGRRCWCWSHPNHCKLLCWMKSTNTYLGPLKSLQHLLYIRVVTWSTKPPYGLLNPHHSPQHTPKIPWILDQQTPQLTLPVREKNLMMIARTPYIGKDIVEFRLSESLVVVSLHNQNLPWFPRRSQRRRRVHRPRHRSSRILSQMILYCLSYRIRHQLFRKILHHVLLVNQFINFWKLFSYELL